MIIIPDTSEDELDQLCASLKKNDLGFGESSFAAGSCYVADCQDIRKAMHIADERMYADKASFYEGHPDLKR